MSIVKLLQEPPVHKLALEYVIRGLPYSQYISDKHEIAERVTESQYELIWDLFNREIYMAMKGWL